MVRLTNLILWLFIIMCCLQSSFIWLGNHFCKALVCCIHCKRYLALQFRFSCGCILILNNLRKVWSMCIVHVFVKKIVLMVMLLLLMYQRFYLLYMLLFRTSPYFKIVLPFFISDDVLCVLMKLCALMKHA